MKPIFLEKAADGPPMLMDGRADALWGAGVGWPAFAALAKQGGRFIVPSAEEIKTILAKNPALQPNTLPAKSYAGQDQPLASVGSWSYVLSTNGTEGRNGLPARARDPPGRSAARRAPGAGARDHDGEHRSPRRRGSELIHPGVLRYLREIKR